MLLNLTEQSGNQSIVEKKEIPAIIGLLSSESEVAAGVMHNLAVNKGNRATIAKEGDQASRWTTVIWVGAFSKARC